MIDASPGIEVCGKMCEWESELLVLGKLFWIDFEHVVSGDQWHAWKYYDKYLLSYALKLLSDLPCLQVDKPSRASTFTLVHFEVRCSSRVWKTLLMHVKQSEYRCIWHVWGKLFNSLSLPMFDAIKEVAWPYLQIWVVKN